MILLRIGRIFWLALIGLIIAEGLSLWGWHDPNMGKVLVAIISVAVFSLACWRLEVGVWIVMAELIVGSKGYLLSWPTAHFNISIRLAIFGAIILAWIITRLRQRNLPFVHSSVFRSYVWLVVYLIAGVFIGYFYRNNLANIFYDVNGYLYLGLLPVIYDAIKSRDTISKTLQVMWAAVVAIFIKTIVLLFLFASQFSFLVQVYRWIRDTRINEVTIIAGNAYRIFSQSQIWGLFGFFAALISITLLGKNQASRRWWWFFLAACGAIVIISYSRSFWLALIFTTLVWLWYLMRYAGRSRKYILKYIGWLVLLLIGELMAIILIIRLPNLLHLNQNSASLSSLVEERLSTNEQAGLQSRWNLFSPLVKKIVRQPVIGHGFGSTITYQSKDPRITKETGGGVYTTFAFEWGYLDILLKIGLVGLMIYGWFLWRVLTLGVRALKTSVSDKPIILGLIFALIALLLTHVTTPYLNHPLGLGLIMVCAVIFERLAKNIEPSTQ